MIQFNMKRFGRLAKWSLTVDKGYYLKTFLQMLVIASLIFIAFTTNFFRMNVNGIDRHYSPCMIVVMAAFLVNTVMGPAMMFYSMKNKHDDQTLMLLPASNFEKYLMRYCTWIIQIPIYLVAFLGADLVQYLVNVVLGSEHVTFVTAFIIGRMDEIEGIFAEIPQAALNAMIAVGVMLHSFYALGGTLFRSHKYAWILTTLAFIVLSLLLCWVLPQEDVDEHTPTGHLLIWDAIYALWVMVNFWLSYKIFCRTQVIGKFVNI